MLGSLSQAPEWLRASLPRRGKLNGICSSKSVAEPKIGCEAALGSSVVYSKPLPVFGGRFSDGLAEGVVEVVEVGEPAIIADRHDLVAGGT